MKKIISLLGVVLPLSCLFSQGVLVSPNPGVPHASAGLEVNFTTKGFLGPRMTTAQRNAIVSPAIGLQLYNTTTNCLEIYMPAGWKSIICNCVTAPNANFTFPGSTLYNNTNYTFQAATPGMTYSWTFASGSPATSTVQNPVVQWANAGTYAVKLVVTDANGCKDSTTQNVTITVGCNPNPPGTLLIQSSGFCDPNPPVGWVQCAGWINTNGDDVSNAVLDGCLNGAGRLRIRVWNQSGNVLEEDVYSTNTNMTAWQSWNYHGGSVTKATFTYWTGSTDYFSSNTGGSACYTGCGTDAPCATLTLGTGNANSVILAPGATNQYEYRINCNNAALPGRIIAVYK